MTNFTTAICLVLGMLVPEAIGDDTHQNDQRQLIECVIEKLASENKMPSGRSDTLPANYSRNAQATVWLAANTLIHFGSEAFDCLIDHGGDTRYAFSYDTPSGVSHVSVGEACHICMSRVLICYAPAIPFVSRDQINEVPWRGRKIEDWWNEHRHDELWKLQLLTIETQLRFQEALTYDTVALNHPFKQKDSEDVFKKKRENALSMLKQMREGILSSKRPFLDNTIDDYFGKMTWLPWPTESFNK